VLRGALSRARDLTAYLAVELLGERGPLAPGRPELERHVVRWGQVDGDRAVADLDADA
jgi:hypothetical protein